MHNDRMKSLMRYLAAISVVGLLITGCSSHNSMDVEDQSSAEMADIAFAQVNLHQQ